VRVSALPWVNQKEFHYNPERVAEPFEARSRLFANSFRVHWAEINAITQGVALGWNLQTPSALRAAIKDDSSTM
jgi:hypothetical protein